MYSLGMDLGTSTVKIVLMQNGTVEKYWLAVHHGRPLLCLRQGLSELAIGRGRDTCRLCDIGDNAGALLERCPVLSELGEIPAIVEGVRRLVPQAGSIIEIGSQGARFITEVRAGPRSLRPTSIAQAAPVPLRIRCPVWAASWRIILRWLSRRRAFHGFPDAAQCLPKRISFTASRKVFPRRISCWDCAMQ